MVGKKPNKLPTPLTNRTIVMGGEGAEVPHTEEKHGLQERRWGLSRSVEIPLQTSGKGFGGLDTSKRSTQPRLGQAWALWARCLQQAPPGSSPGPACCSLEARDGAPSALPLCPGWAVPPSGAVGHRRVQRWTRCDTHSFNCTYTKEGEAVGLLREGSRGCCCRQWWVPR